MALQIGIVGLPNVGKSTLFNALTRAGAQVAPYPFTTIEPNIGVVPLEDERLRWLGDLVRPERVVPTSIEFVDIAGLVRDAHRGEGLGNQFLAHIRNVDAVAMVLRAFEDPEVAHVSARLDPVEDVATVDTELSLADMATVDNRVERIRQLAKAKPREYGGQFDFLKRLSAYLNEGGKARSFERSEGEQGLLDELFLLTDKPRLYVLNLGEAQLELVDEVAAPLRALAEREGAPLLTICARLEADLAEWDAEEARQYRQDLGLSASGLQTIVRASYQMLDLITFLTMVGGKEVRAWEIGRDTSALKSAGKVHSDMERGFIRAEVVAFDDLEAAGSLASARERGMVRLEGRNYLVQDGDIMQFRFNP